MTDQPVTSRTRTRPRARFDHGSSSGYHSPRVDADVKLNTNESPYLPPEAFFDRLAERVRASALYRYPDREAVELRARIAQLHGVRVENVFCGNGSDEVLLTLALAYGGPDRKTLVSEPTFSMHALSAEIAGGEVLRGSRDDDHHIVESELRVLAPQADITYLCSPNNPTGVAERRQNLETVLASTDGVVVADEAYGQFADWTAEDFQDEDTALVVLRTFSKTWSLAGIRLGYAIGPTWLIENLWQVALPYHLSQITQAAGILALDYEAQMDERVGRLKSERDRVQSALDALGVRTWPSQANFILYRPDQPADDVWQSLVDHGVLVRNVSTWTGLGNCLRVTIGTPDENDRFLNAMQEALA